MKKNWISKPDGIPNNGICIRVPGFVVRVLKSADDGGVPAPGDSTPRQNFYNQKQAILDFKEFRNGNKQAQPTWGVIVHWLVDKDYNLPTTLNRTSHVPRQ